MTMQRYMLLAIFLLTLLPMKTLAAADECPPLDESLSPNITYEAPEGQPNIEPLVPQITDYLNAGGAANALADYFTGTERDESLFLISMGSEAFTVDMNADGSDELVITVFAVHNVRWGGEVLFYRCADGAYTLIDQADEEGWSWVEMGGFHVIDIADHTGNEQPEVYIERFDTTHGVYFETLAWDGAGFSPLMWYSNAEVDPQPDIFGHNIDFIDFDEDGTVEVQIHFLYDGRGLRDFAYNDIYQIHDEAFHFHCQVYLGDENFLDDPTDQFLIETLEQADSTFRCGYDDAAEPLFRQVVEDDSLLEAPVWNDKAFFERENLRAFSLYRLVLLNVRRGDPRAALESYEELQAKFPVEVPGSNYTSMAEAFWLEYERSGDWEAACDALAAHIEPTVTAILEDDPLTRRSNGLYVSPYAGYPGHRPNALIRGCPEHDVSDPARTN